MKEILSFKLGPFTVIPNENTIEKRDGIKVALQQKFIQVLVHLVQQYPRLVSREELIDSVWGGNYYVGERALTNAIWNLRHELKCTEGDCIKTVRKSGYLLLIKPENFNKTKATDKTKSPVNLNNIVTKRASYSVILTTLVMLGAVLFYLSSLVIDDSNTKISNSRSDIAITNITTDPGREVFGAISPNQHFIVYSWRRIKEHTHLYISDLTQPDLKPRQLTFGDNRESRPIWSSDGEQIYFIRKSADQSLCEIVRMDLDTSQEKVLAKCPGTIVNSISLANGGQKLAFTGISEGYLTPGVYLLDLTEANAIPVRFSCGDECSYVEYDFAFSPNGKYLAVTRQMKLSNEDIYLIDLASKEARQLTFGEANIVGLAWHPDSERLVYSSENSDKREGSVISLKDNKVRKLDVPGLSFPRFIPDSNEIVYHDWRVLSFVSFLPLSSSIQAVPFPLIQSEYSHHSPHYSALAKRLVYISNESGNNEIWSSAADGTERKKLTNLKTNLMAPRWSHDGKSIAFLGPKSDGQGNALYILDAKKLSVRKLETPFNEHLRPSWALDDSALIAAASDKKNFNLYQFNLNNDAVKNLGGDAASFAIQISDSKILFTKGRYEGLWILDLERPASEPKPLLNEQEFVVRYNWVVTDKGLYYQQEHEGHYSINKFDFNTKQIDSLVHLPVRTMRRFSSMTFIPEEERLLFTQTEYPQVDIKRLRHPLLE